MRTLAFLPLIVAVGTDCRAETFRNSLAMELVRIPAGEFERGSPPTEAGRRPDEKRARVRLTKSYYLGQCEVTRGQFRRFVAATGYKTQSEWSGLGGYGYDGGTRRLTDRSPKYSWRETGFPQTDEHPVVNVTWNDAVAFCHWLGALENRIYRLPTEAEWEYACRGGSTTAFCNGDHPDGLAEVGNVIDALARRTFSDRTAIRTSDGYVFTAPVASFKANSFGLHDMHGNVWEWCADWYAPYPAGPQVDPQGPSHGDPKLGRVIRGGDWYHDWSFARSAQRYYIPPDLPRRHGGFRVVMEPKAR